MKDFSTDFHKTRASGFTLLELMIVIAIIGIIAVVSLPAYNAYIETANMSKVTAAYENAVRTTRSVFVKSRSRTALGLSSGIPSNVQGWIELYNPDGTMAPGSGPAYVTSYGASDYPPEVNGGVHILYRTDLGRVTIFRPRYLNLVKIRANITLDSADFLEM